MGSLLSNRSDHPQLKSFRGTHASRSRVVAVIDSAGWVPHYLGGASSKSRERGWRPVHPNNLRTGLPPTFEKLPQALHHNFPQQSPPPSPTRPSPPSPIGFANCFPWYLSTPRHLQEAPSPTSPNFVTPTLVRWAFYTPRVPINTTPITLQNLHCHARRSLISFTSPLEVPRASHNASCMY